MIYIDPPYNTNSDKFLYPDKFDKEEQEVLKLSGLSDDDIERLEFSFKTPKSHNGWLTFMYPRLKLAKDLLSDEGVIFISIDDNEQANLKLLCDEIFGENNFVSSFVWKCRNSLQHEEPLISSQTERIIMYCKDKNYYLSQSLSLNRVRKPYDATEYSNPDNDPRGPWLSSGKTRNDGRPEYTVTSPTGKKFTKPWIPSPQEFAKWEQENLIWWGKDGNSIPRKKSFLKDFRGNAVSDLLQDEYIDEIQVKNEKIKRTKIYEIGTTEIGSKEVKNLFGGAKIFDYPKPHLLMKYLIYIATDKDSIILDFFAGSGTTGHAVMQLNSEDNGNRKFILCQIDEDIDKNKNKEAYQFCKDNNLPPCISSITCERLNRAGNKINKGDTGYKVFDLVQKPHLNLDKNGQMEILENNLTPIDRIYNLIAQIGIDCPDTAPKEILKDCMYLYENNGTKNYYITNSGLLDNIEGKKLFKEAISNGNIYIDGWTATLNTTLQEQKDNIKIIF